MKTSITLPEDLVRIIDARVGRAGNRSLFIETAIRNFLAQAARAARDDHDLEILDRHADALNREAEDALAFQVLRR